LSAYAAILIAALALGLAPPRGDQVAAAGKPGVRDGMWLAGQVLRYTARCALRPDQTLVTEEGRDGKPLQLRGEFGLAPEWQRGECAAQCQERVSACLLAHMNRSGAHVTINMLGAPSWGSRFTPSDADIRFPYQEGAFFGNVFSGLAFVCRGREVKKAPAIGRFCALEPSTCQGITRLADVGACQDACEMSCARLSDGSQRCVAISCRDPGGRRWSSPLTVYVGDAP
jgi:hypothetical protein